MVIWALIALANKYYICKKKKKKNLRLGQSKSGFQKVGVPNLALNGNNKNKGRNGTNHGLFQLFQEIPRNSKKI